MIGEIIVMLISSEEWQGDPREVLNTSPIGSMLPFMGRQTFDTPIEVIFGIREESCRIPFVKNNPIKIRTGVLEEVGVYLIPIVLRLCYEGSPTEYFESWLNIYPSDSFAAEIFRVLSRQRRIVLQFFGESSQIERILFLPNNIGYWLRLNLTQNPQQKWSYDEFDQAREQIYRQFATIKELFYHLAHPQVRRVIDS